MVWDFYAWLEADSWTLRTEVQHADVVTGRDGRRLYMEARAELGLDVDTAYGNLLFRTSAQDGPAAR